MKIMFNRQLRRSPWGGGAHFMSSFVDYLRGKGHVVVFQLEDGIDKIFMMDPRPEEGGYDFTQLARYKATNPRVEIIHRINECDKRKGTDEIDRLLLVSNRLADRTIFISSWLRDYFFQRGLKRPSDVVYNGCNTEFFYPDPDRQEFHDPIRIVTHHWSDNWLKGFDAYKDIDELCESDKRFQFTYVGRYSNRYQPRATRIVDPLYGSDLGSELRKHDVYITASRWEPCGMHHIEGAASGLPVLYHRDGGGIVEGCQTHGEMFHDRDSMISALEKIVSNYSSYRSKIDMEKLSSKTCHDSYYGICFGN